MKKYHGIIPPIITPIDEREHVDEAALRRLVRICVDNGLHGIFVAGSNGESLALTQKERNRAIRIALEEAGDVFPVMCGVMDSSTQRVIDNVKALEDMGGKTAVVSPVFYARHATQQETVRHFEAIAAHTNLDLVIYNIPKFTGQILAPETIFKLAQIDHVVCYKDSSDDFPGFLRCIERFRGTDFCLLQGSTALSAAGMLLGADGCIPSLAPLFPQPYIQMYECAMKRDIDATMRWNQIVMQTCSIYPMAKSQTSSTKYAMSKLGEISPRTIAPNEPISEVEMQRIDSAINALREYLPKELQHETM